jgi:hypothetical protein
MMPGQPTGADAVCAHCGSVLRANAPFCGSCGQAVTNRQTQPSVGHAARPQTAAQPSPAVGTDQLVGAGRGVRCCCYLLDLAAMMSPALPLAIAGAILGVAEVVYIVVPIAFVAVWAWMQIWQGFTGMSFGKAMMGLRLIRAADRHAPGLAATVMRSGVFAGTAGLAALEVVTSPVPRDGLHDRLSGLTLIDITLGANPLGPRQQTALRKSIDRSLNKVHSPVPLGASGRQ